MSGLVTRMKLNVTEDRKQVKAIMLVIISTGTSNVLPVSKGQWNYGLWWHDARCETSMQDAIKRECNTLTRSNLKEPERNNKRLHHHIISTTGESSAS